MKVGIRIYCATCGKQKAPRGRSVPPEIAASFCSSDMTRECPGYRSFPLSGDLWPGETEEEFGFPCSSNATEDTP